MESTRFTKRLMLLINPVSGKRMIVRYLPEVIRACMDAGYLVTTMVTSERGEATTLTRRYCRDYDRIICAGGDGTMNETITGLAAANHVMPLGYIPCGSTNDFAVSHGLPVDIVEAASCAATGVPAPYDIGQLEDRYFAYVAAFGAFSAISYNTDQNLKNMVGHAAYIMGGLMELSQIKPVALRIQADDAVFEGDFAFGAVCNTTSIGGTLTLPDGIVHPADGILELLLVRMPDDLIELDEIIHGLLEQDYSSPLLEFVQAKDIVVTSEIPLDWSLDGESGGAYATTHITAVPNFLQLCR